MISTAADMTMPEPVRQAPLQQKLLEPDILHRGLQACRHGRYPSIAEPKITIPCLSHLKRRQSLNLLPNAVQHRRSTNQDKPEILPHSRFNERSGWKPG